MISIATKQKQTTFAVTFTVPADYDFSAVVEHLESAADDQGAKIVALNIYPAQ